MLAEPYRHFWLAIIAISFLASGGIFVKLSTLPPIHTGFYRVVFSVFLLYPLVKNKLPPLRSRAVATILLAGVFLAFDLILWNISFEYTTVANANLLANLVPFTTIPVSYFLFKERIPPRFLVGTLITVTGVVLLVSGKLHASPDNYYGDLLAFATSVFYALFLLSVYRVRPQVNALAIMFISAFGAAPVLLGAMLWQESLYLPLTFRDFYPLIGLAVFSQIIGQGLLSHCLGKLHVLISSLLVLTQPLMAAVYSFFLFHERLSGWEITGMLVTLTGVYLAKKSGSSRKPTAVRQPS